MVIEDFEAIKKLKNLNSRLLKNHKALRIKNKALEDELTKQKNQEFTHVGKKEKLATIDFFSSFFARLENLANANSVNVQQKLKAILEAYILNFQVQFNTQFIRFKRGERFDISYPADVRSCIATGDQGKHSVLTRVLKMPYETDGELVRGQVEALVFRQGAKSIAYNEELGKKGEDLVLLVPIKIGKTLKKAVEITTESAQLNQRVKLNFDFKIAPYDRALIWVGETGKHLSFKPYKEQNLYYIIEKRDENYSICFQDDFETLGKIKLKN